MEPFAYQKKPRRDRRRLILTGLAAASLSIWYFDLVPELTPVSTGNLDQEVTDPDATADEFVALLESSTEVSPEELVTDEILTEPVEIAETVETAGDPLLNALASEPEPIEAAFPEFGDVGQGVAESEAMDMTPQEAISAVDASANTDVAAASEVESGVQQVAFSQSSQTEPKPELATTVLSGKVADHLNDIDAWIDAGETLEAHAALSRLYWKQPDVRSHIQERLRVTAAEIYTSPSRHFATPYMVEFGDTLDSIAQKYHVPWQYLAQLNHVTPKTLQAGQKLKVLTGPFGAVVDLEKKEMTVHAHGWYVRSYRVGVGRDHSTPKGEFRVKEKLENPTWYNPDGGVIDADDPANPLGEYWIGLGDHIGIHGTIDPDSIGATASRGCIHLGDQDIQEVFFLLGSESTVVIR